MFGKKDTVPHPQNSDKTKDLGKDLGSMNQEKQLFSKALSELQARRENIDREGCGALTEYEPLIEEAEALLQKCAANEVVMDTGDESLSELYFLAAELLFGSDLALKAATHTKSLANEAKALEYYNKAIELQDKEEYSYELWNFLSTAGHEAEGIAALERFIERTGGTAKVLSRAAEYILMYADSEDAKTIQKSLDYFYRAIEMEPERYETYWAYYTDLEEAVDVCPQLFKEAVLCLDKLIELSLPEDAENHDTLGNRYFDLTVIYTKMKEYEKALDTVQKGLAVSEGSNYGNTLIIDILINQNRFEEAIPYCHNRLEALMNQQKVDSYLANAFFDLAHCCHMTNQPELAAKYYLAFENAQDIVPQKYRTEYLIYHKGSKSLWGRLKKLLGKVCHPLMSLMLYCLCLM